MLLQETLRDNYQGSVGI